MLNSVRKSILFCLSLTFLCFQEGYTQVGTGQIDSLVLTGDLQNDLPRMLPSGSYRVYVMGSLVQDPRLPGLIKKFNNFLATHYDWFVQVTKMNPDTILPYHPDMLMSEVEYQEYLQMLDEIRIAPSDTGLVKIYNNNGFIDFKVEKNNAAKNLGYIYISKQYKRVNFLRKNISFVSFVVAKDSNNFLGNKWKGYKWKYSNIKNEEQLSSVDKIMNNDFIVYDFILGYISFTGKIFIEIDTKKYKHTSGKKISETRYYVLEKILE